MCFPAMFDYRLGNIGTHNPSFLQRDAEEMSTEFDMDTGYLRPKKTVGCFPDESLWKTGQGSI